MTAISSLPPLRGTQNWYHAGPVDAVGVATAAAAGDAAAVTVGAKDCAAAGTLGLGVGDAVLLAADADGEGVTVGYEQ